MPLSLSLALVLLASFAGVIGAMAWVVIRVGGGGGGGGKLFAREGLRRHVALALFVTVLVVVALAGWTALPAASWRTYDSVVKDPATLRLEVQAHQWSWQARYPGGDGAFRTPDDVIVWNELPIPAGVPVAVELTSADVVHGFNVPALRLRLDIVPGQVSRTWFIAPAEGRLELACVQYCGVEHLRMRGALKILSPEAFAAWQRDASERAARTTPAR